jgi:hypothetical protein
MTETRCDGRVALEDVHHAIVAFYDVWNEECKSMKAWSPLIAK